MVTEAGFGADLGAEKFVDIKCRKSGLRPDAAVVVATVRALKFHGGVDVPDLATEDLGAVERGMENLARHLRNVREVYGIPCVVALNRFPADTDEEVRRVVELVDELGVRAFPATHFADGGAGATDLAKGVLDLLEGADRVDVRVHLPRRRVAEGEGGDARAPAVRRVQRHLGRRAKRRLDRLEADGYGGLPICVAKTQYSFSTDATLRGAPTGHDLHVREVRLSAGAGFVVLVCGDVMTMPGLPADPRRRPDRPPRRRHHRRPVLTRWRGLDPAVEES